MTKDDRDAPSKERRKRAAVSRAAPKREPAKIRLPASGGPKAKSRRALTHSPRPTAAEVIEALRWFLDLARQFERKREEDPEFGDRGGSDPLLEALSMLVQLYRQQG